MTRTRDDIELDLAFHVNGTLSEAETAEVDAWLAKDDALRDEHDALAKIRAEMQAEEVSSPGAFGLARLMRDVGQKGAVAAAPQAPSRTWMWQMAAGLAVAALLGQNLWLRGGDAPGYQLASAETSADMVVAFAPDATDEQIRGLLLGLDVEIIAGPSALGFYDLGVLEGGDASAAITGLRAATGIIESVEDANY